MSNEEDLAIITQQEELLRWDKFDADIAWRLGSLIREMLLTRGVGGTTEIELAGQVLFTATTVGANPGQANWIRRKRNTVHHFSRSSYGVRLKLERDGETMDKFHGLSLLDHAEHGGGFPLWVNGAGCIGSIIVSGMPQRDDHNMAVSAIAKVLGVEAPALP